VKLLLTPLLASWVAAKVLWTRLWRGPAHPRWSLSAELVLRVTQRLVAVLHDDMTTLKRVSQYGQLSPRMRQRVRVEAGSLGGMPVEEHHPRNARGPTLLYFHGGGYVVCNPASHRELVAQMAWSCGTRALALDYRKAPEAPWPAALEDALAAIAALREQGVTDLWLAGDSAGGGLAVCSMVAMKQRGLEPVRGAILLSPWIDLTEAGRDPALDSDLDYLSSRELTLYSDAYVQKANASDPTISPIYADLAGLPPQFVSAGSAETLCEQAERYIARCRAAGSPVERLVHEGMWHVYPMFSMLLPEGREALKAIGAWVRSGEDA